MHLPPVASLAVMFPELKRGVGGVGVQGGVNNALNNVAETVMNGDGAGRREKKIRAARDEGRRGAASDAGQMRENTPQISEAGVDLDVGRVRTKTPWSFGFFKNWRKSGKMEELLPDVSE